MAGEKLLEVKDLTLSYRVKGLEITPVNRVSFEIEKHGQALAVVGESGCGKSSLAKALMRQPDNNVSRFSGEVRLEGADVLALAEKEFREKVLWKKIAWVTQAVSGMLNPVKTIEWHFEEIFHVHGAAYSRAKLTELLQAVKLNAEEVAKLYPHQPSGGMLQRILIALALALRPPLIILDEPTSALDASTQGGVINLLDELKRGLGISYIFITHDIKLASKFCESIAVIYGARIVERGPTDLVLGKPLHPYTKALRDCVPEWGRGTMHFIPGAPPDLRTVAKGCPFWPREGLRCDSCSAENEPQLVDRGGGHFVACHGVPLKE